MADNIYGNLVQLSNLRVQGARPDGSVAPGADMAAIVDFDPVGAGCDDKTGFCTPGADVQWYVNGQLFQEAVASGYDGSLGGYSTAIGFTAPSSGTIDISAKSSNQVDAPSFQVVALGAEPGEGTVRVNDVTCGNSPYYNCSCEANGELIIYYARSVVNVGSGTAYVNVLLDGNLAVENQPTSTAGGEGMDSVAIPCPDSKVDHVITVVGRDGVGSSVTLKAGTPLGGKYTGEAPVVTPMIPDQGPISEVTPVLVPMVPVTPSPVQAGVCQGMFRDGNFDLSCASEPENATWIIGGALAVAVVGALLYFVVGKEEREVVGSV